MVFRDVTHISGRVLPRILKEHFAFILKSQEDRGELVHLALENKGDVFVSYARSH
jgi:hypothetical protein